MELPYSYFRPQYIYGPKQVCVCAWHVLMHVKCACEVCICLPIRAHSSPPYPTPPTTTTPSVSPKPPHPTSSCQGKSYLSYFFDRITRGRKTKYAILLHPTPPSPAPTNPIPPPPQPPPPSFPTSPHTHTTPALSSPHSLLSGNTSQNNSDSKHRRSVCNDDARGRQCCNGVTRGVNLTCPPHLSIPSWQHVPSPFLSHPLSSIPTRPHRISYSFAPSNPTPPTPAIPSHPAPPIPSHPSWRSPLLLQMGKQLEKHLIARRQS